MLYSAQVSKFNICYHWLQYEWTISICIKPWVINIWFVDMTVIPKDLLNLPSYQVSSKGSLTGGYFNTSRSRLEIQKARSELRDQITSAETELRTLQDTLRNTEQEINKIVSEMQKTEIKNSKAKWVSRCFVKLLKVAPNTFTLTRSLFAY